MEGIQEGHTSKNIPSTLEATVEWLGVRISSSCGIRISNDEKQKLTEILRKRMTALSVQDPLLYFQLVESSSTEGIAEWEQLLAILFEWRNAFLPG